MSRLEKLRKVYGKGPKTRREENFHKDQAGPAAGKNALELYYSKHPFFLAFLHRFIILCIKLKIKASCFRHFFRLKSFVKTLTCEISETFMPFSC